MRTKFMKRDSYGNHQQRFWENRKDMDLISAKLGINAKKLNRILTLEQLPDEELLARMVKLCKK